MIRRMCLATMLLLVGGFVSCDFVHSAGTSSFLADARALNELSRERFGVGISALHLLVRSKPNVFFEARATAAQASEIAQLEEERLVTVKKVVTSRGEMTQLLRTERGDAIASAIEAAQR